MTASLTVWVCNKKDQFHIRGSLLVLLFYEDVFKVQSLSLSFKVSLLSLLIFCSLSVSAEGQRAVTLEEPCLDTICAALALHAHHHMMTLTSTHRSNTQARRNAYTPHTHIYSTFISTTLDRCSYTNNPPE